jgi:hypothetical protein
MYTKNRFSILVTGVVILGIVLSCGLAGSTAAPPAGAAATQPPVEATASPTIDSAATANAKATQDAQATLDAQATVDAQATGTAAAEKTQQALDKAATATQEAGFKLTATADIIQKSTAQAQGMVDVVQKLADDGVIASTEGEYHRLDDFDETFAQLGYYQWWQTGTSAENFVMAGDFSVSSASKSANWFHSACGVVFNLIDNRNHNIVWMAMDGRAYMQSVHNGNQKLFVILRYAPASTTEITGHFTMVVFDKHVTLYVDDQEVFSVYDAVLSSGLVAYSMVSGSNKDFGTRCQMSDIDLWILK